MPAPKTVVYISEDGAETIREGGSRAWRNNNPGNIQKGSFADANGAIGGDSRFAIFPDEKVGLAAIVTLLQGPSYRDLTLEGAINRYAPPSENNTDGYIDFVANQTGINAGATLDKLTKPQVTSVAKAIKQIEGWLIGSERANAPIVMEATPSTTRPDAPLVSAARAASDWMDIAIGEAGLPARERSEWPDPGENPRILNYFKTAAPWFDPDGGDEVDWCAAFANYCLETAGYSGTGHPGARSFYWNKSGLFIKLKEPVYGCVAVFRKAPFDDENWKTGPGHVGFVTSWTKDTVNCLGGNQSKTVMTKTYARKKKDADGNTIRKIVAFMMPVMN